MKLDFRVFGLGALLGLFVAVAPGCGSTSSACNATNCKTGCCSAQGACLTGTTDSSCGSGGALCSACTTNDTCSAGVCVPRGTGGGTGGGVGGGTGGGTGGGVGGGTGGGTGGGVGGGTGGGVGGGTGGGGGGTDAGTGGGTGGGVGGGTGGGGGGTDAGTGGGVGGGTGGGGGGTDAGTGGGTGGGGGTTDAGVDVSAQIAAIRAEADVTDGGTVSLPITGGLVSHLKPFVTGSTTDPAGFFVQSQQMGPAVFVAVDPATLTPSPAVGDSVSFTATSVGVVSGLRQVTALSGFTRNSAGNPVSSLTQSTTNVDFTMAANIDAYESELTSFTGSVTAVGTAGSGYSSATITTAGTTTGTSLRLRLPTTLQATENLAVGCTVTATGVPLWRFTTQAQPSTWSSSELAGTTCPAPRVTGAEALNATTVRVTFDRNIASSSVTSGAFTITGGNGGLTVSAAMNSTPTQVVLTTSAQTGGTTYTVTVASSVQDTRGRGVDAAANTAMFLAARPNDCTAPVVISQVYGAGGNAGAVQTHDFIELHNRTNMPVNLAGWSVQYQSAASTGAWTATAPNKYVFDAGTIPAGGYFLVLGAPGTSVDAGPPPVTPDVLTALSLGGTSGKVALVNNSTSLTGCPVGAADGGGTVDFFGYGSTANCSENGMPYAGTFTNAQSLQRNEQSGAQLTCTDTNSNSVDFVAITPVYRNSATTPNVCTCP